MNNVNDCRKEIKSIGQSVEKLSARIQVAALFVINHAHVHGDISLAVDLCKAVGKGMKHEALRVYMGKFGPMNPDKEGVLKYAKGKKLEGDALKVRMEEAAKEDWHAAPTEKNAEEFTLAGGVHALLGKLNKSIEQGEYQPTDADKELIAALSGYATANPKPAKVKALPAKA